MANTQRRPSEEQYEAPTARSATKLDVGGTPEKRDPYATGPSDYQSFDRLYASNAGAAKQGAGEVAQKVSSEATEAQKALNNAYGSWMAGGSNEAFTAPAAVQGQFSQAQADARALGSTGGIQQLMGPQASRMGAAFVQRAGGNFKSAPQDYAGLSGRIAEVEKGSKGYVENQAEKKATDAAQESMWRNYSNQYQQYLAGHATQGGGVSEGGGTMSYGPPLTYEEWLDSRGIDPQTGAAGENTWVETLDPNRRGY